jgi:hypothetical protein
MPLGMLAGVLAMSAQAATFSFDQDAVGAPPSGWTCGATGKGSPRWTVEVDAAATGKNRVLRQSGSAPFPWCVRKDVTLADGFVEVRFRSEAGREDQAGGLVWRWRDGDNYYVARANALENNVSLYYAVGGSRKTLKYVDAPVPVKQWHTLRVEFGGMKIAVILNGTKYIEMDDDHIRAPGAVGVWTKADSVTSFDRFTYGAAK